MSMQVPLLLAPGQFFGGARLSWGAGGITVSHRVAEAPPDAVLTHTHEDAHFVLVTGGHYVSIASGSQPASAPPLIYNPPGTTHRDHFEGGFGSFFAVSLQPQVAAMALAAISAPDGPAQLTTLRQHALAMRVAAACGRQPDELSVATLCFELMGTLDQRPPSEPPSAPGWLHSAVELLHDRYAEDLTIADVSASVGVHPIHLARTFRRCLRCTPGEFTRLRRLQKALTLLLQTALPLSAVALASGFADQSHFNKVFARAFGLPPGQYRELAGGNARGAVRFQIDNTRFSRWTRMSAWAESARASVRKPT